MAQTKRELRRLATERIGAAEAYAYASKLVAHDYRHNGSNVREDLERLERVCRQAAETYESEAGDR